jgi:2-polyprenyl-6-methoxyphenol hydroxylase-like FAD-dependent oxidoreductase
MSASKFPSQSDMECTDVIICGCGPTGAILSALLGQHEVKNIVLERELGVTEDPRGIALDEDGIRCLQAAGLYDKIFSEIGESECTEPKQKMALL